MKLIVEELTFRGLLGRTNITLNKTNQVWEILSHTSTEHPLGSYNGSKLFPLGLQSWSMTVDCGIKKASKEMKLKLSKVLNKCCPKSMC